MYELKEIVVTTKMERLSLCINRLREIKINKLYPQRSKFKLVTCDVGRKMNFVVLSNFVLLFVSPIVQSFTVPGSSSEKP